MGNWSFREYTDPQHLYEKIEAYFVYCQDETAKNFEAGVKMIKAPSVAGLSLYLQISKQTFYKYLRLPQYENLKDVLQVARQKLEDYYVSMGFSGSKFSEFMLRNTFSEHYTEKSQDDAKEYVPLSIQVDKPLLTQEPTKAIEQAKTGVKVAL